MTSLLDIWNRDYNEWSDLKDFSAHLHDFNKEPIHFTYKKEIDSLRTLFPKDHPAQLKLTIMEDQLKVNIIINIYLMSEDIMK